MEWKPAYKVGDKVRVRTDLTDTWYKDETGKENGCGCVEPMLKMAGKVVTIKEVDYRSRCYRIKECGWNWVYGEFEGLAEEPPKQTTKYKVGDRVRVISKTPAGKRRFYMENGSDFEYEAFIGGMRLFCGKVLTIREATKGGYRTEEARGWIWTDEMFDGLVDDSATERWEPPEDESLPPFKEPWEELF